MHNKKELIVKLSILLIAIVCLFSAFIYQNMLLNNKNSDYIMNEGVIYTDGKNKQTLEGEWEFYYGKLLVTDNLDLEASDYISVPSKWNTKENGNLCKNGYASYRGYIKGLDVGTIITIGFDNMSVSYNIYVNREYVGGSGVVSKDNDKTLLNSISYGDQINFEYYEVKSDDPVEVIIEVSCVKNAGLYKVPTLFLNREDSYFLYNKFIQKSILLGILIIAFVMHAFRIFVQKNSSNILALLGILLIAAYSILSGTIYAYSASSLDGLLSSELIDIIADIIDFIIVATITINLFTRKELKRSIIGSSLILLSYLILLVANLLKPLSLYEGNSLYIYIMTIHSILIIISLLFFFEKENNDIVVYMNELSLISLVIVEFFKILNKSGYIYYGTRNVESMFMVLSFIFSIIGYFVVQKRTTKVVESSKRLTEDNTNFRINLLLNQIKPHFLYNTLNSINSLCKIDPSEASKAIVTFSNYLRNNMDSISDSNLITVSKELEHVRTYIDIEKMRFRDRLNVEYDINSTKFSLPPLSIQAIVENAIKHGMSSKIQGVKILIRTYEDEKFYYVYINDNGVGFDINSIAESDSVGLSNVCRRIEMLCKGELEFTSIIGKGTIVILKLKKEE